MALAVLTPELPDGEMVSLGGRGSVYLRRAGAADAPSVVLLHGWSVNGAINWFRVWRHLADDYHLIIPDLRNHGNSQRTGRNFTLADCADDVAELCATLGVRQATAVGYSMGGPVALHLASRHPQLVRGLVLQATSLTWADTRKDHWWWHRTLGMARVVDRLGLLWPGVGREVERIMSRDPEVAHLRDWLVAEARRTSTAELIPAAHELRRFRGHDLVPSIAAPTSVVITEADATVPLVRQREMAAALEAHQFMAEGASHHVVVTDDSFGRLTRKAIESTFN